MNKGVGNDPILRDKSLGIPAAHQSKVYIIICIVCYIRTYIIIIILYASGTLITCVIGNK